jgi:hypothetical protein
MKFLLSVIALLVLVSCKSKSPSQDTAELPRPDIHPVVAPPPSGTTEPLTGNAADAGPAPKITFDRVRHNFGNIYHAERVTHEFTFTNTGQQDLLVTGVKASCGCTQPTYPTEPIAPGEQGAISVLYNSVGKQGTQKADIRVKTNDPENPEVVLYLSGRVLVKPQ